MREPRREPDSHCWHLSDGYELNGRIWPARKPTDTAILYLHGIQSHGGWYAYTASELAELGHPVILADRRGSGRNLVGRGDVQSFQRWLADLDELSEWAKQNWGVSRAAVVAVSWGGKLAMAWSGHRGHGIPMLLLAPGLFPQVDVSIGTKLRIAGSLLIKPAQQFEIPLSDPALFTDNPAGRNFIRNDQQKLTSATARFLYQSSRLDAYWKSAAVGIHKTDLKVCLAERDRIVNNQRTIAWLEKLTKSDPDVQIVHAAHSLEFEPEMDPILGVLRSFSETL